MAPVSVWKGSNWAMLHSSRSKVSQRKVPTQEGCETYYLNCIKSKKLNQEGVHITNISRISTTAPGLLDFEIERAEHCIS